MVKCFSISIIITTNIVVVKKKTTNIVVVKKKTTNIECENKNEWKNYVHT